MTHDIPVNNDLSERVAYNDARFPFYLQDGILSTYPNYSAISHWHTDVEFIYVISGQMSYNINGRIVAMQPGEGIFVNTRQLHYGFSPEHQECLFICVLLHPLLLCTSPHIETRFVTPVLENQNFPYLLLRRDHEHARKILDCILAMKELNSSEIYELQVQELFYRIWGSLYQLSDHTKKSPVPQNQHLTLLKDMIHFISSHYTEKITLDDICAAGSVGKTMCCNIFRKYTSQTPITYLTKLRLEKSTELLRNTDKTISELCFEVGFSGASYFTEAFRRMYGCTPREYRQSLHA